MSRESTVFKLDFQEDKSIDVRKLASGAQLPLHHHTSPPDEISDLITRGGEAALDAGLLAIKEQ